MINVTSISVVILERELELINKSEWIRILLTPFFVCALFSVFFALGGVVIGARELKAGHNIKLTYTGIVLNSLLLIYLAVLVITHFDALLATL